MKKILLSLVVLSGVMSTAVASELASKEAELNQARAELQACIQRQKEEQVKHGSLAERVSRLESDAARLSEAKDVQESQQSL